MPTYMLHGFKWPREGFHGIRVYIVLHNLEDATAEYLQQPLTSQLVLDSLKRKAPDVMSRIPGIQLIEQYDPEDISSNAAVSQPHAYVGAKVVTMPDPRTPGSGLSWDVENLVKDPGLSKEETEALTQLRDAIAPGEKIGWYVVYNGDPERYFPESDEDESMDDYEEEDEDTSVEEPVRPTTTEKTVEKTTRFPDKIRGLFSKKNTATAA